MTSVLACWIVTGSVSLCSVVLSLFESDVWVGCGGGFGVGSSDASVPVARARLCSSNHVVRFSLAGVPVSCSSVWSGTLYFVPLSARCFNCSLVKKCRSHVTTWPRVSSRNCALCALWHLHLMLLRLRMSLSDSSLSLGFALKSMEPMVGVLECTTRGVGSLLLMSNGRFSCMYTSLNMASSEISSRMREVNGMVMRSRSSLERGVV